MYPDCLCSANNYKISHYIYKDNKFSIIQCRECGLARTWPQPIQAEERDSFYNSQDDYLDRFERISVFKKLVARIIKNIKKIRKQGKLLEIGCNMGIFVEAAVKQGYDASGIDISATAISFGVEKLGLKDRISPGSLADISAQDRKFDLVVYIHVFEHIENIVEELNNVKKIINSQGLIVIEVPNYNSLWRIITGGRWYGYSPAQHIWHFSKKPLEKILKQQGYTVVYVSTRWSLYHKINFSLEGIIKIFAHIISFSFNKGDNLFIIAQKNES